MKRTSLSALAVGILALTSLTSYGQVKPIKSTDQDYTIIHKSVPNEQGIIRCHTMEADSILRSQNPGMPTIYEWEKDMQNGIRKYQQQLANGTQKKVVTTIPIIFHIITDGAPGGENISAVYVQAQVDQLNLDYRNLAGSSYAVAADCEVQFCLAAVDPGGAPLVEPGINRVTTYGGGPFGQTNFQNTIKPGTQWDPTQYFNVWVGNLSGGLLGYAQFPEAAGLAGIGTGNGAANTDGVVIGYQTLGSNATPFPGGAPYNRGRTLTHEAGHWLGLRHVWGDGGCNVDDFCADTPKSDAANYGCPNTNSCTDSYGAPWPTANPADMVENYMDYTDDSCMDTYTADQKTRIQYVLANCVRRSSLGSSTVCNVATDPDDAGIFAVVSPTGTICGSSVDAIVTLKNYGTATLTSCNITWDIDGGAPTVYPWTGSLASGAQVDVTLATLSPSAGPHTFNVATSLPNGNTDPNTGNDANSSSFTIDISGQAIDLLINTDCYGEEVVWELYDAGANLVASGGNQNVTLPVTATQNTSAGDPGAYPSETAVNIQWCLSPGCYDFVMWDAYGDGMNGSQWGGCNTDGDYTISDAGANVLASMIAANGDYGFTETVNFCVASPCASTFNSSQTATENCFGDDTGAISVTFATGNATGATYDIGAGPQGTGVFTGLAQGSYTITIVDGDACTSTVPFTVTGPAQLNANITVNNISCNGQTDGSVVVTATGGTPSITYNIGAGAVANGTFSGLTAGGYTVTVVDGNGCSTSVNGTVVEPTVLTASVGTITPEYFGNDGSVDLTVSGGTSPYTYAWTGTGYSSSVQDPSNMPGGTYSVTVTDASGCQVTINNVVVPSELGIEDIANIDFVIYPNPSNGTFNVQLTNVNGVYNVSATDVAGRIVYENNTISGNSFVVNLADVASGTYMLNVQTETNILTKRIVVRK